MHSSLNCTKHNYLADMAIYLKPNFKCNFEMSERIFWMKHDHMQVACQIGLI